MSVLLHHETGLLVLQVGEERVFLGAVDVDLLEHVEGDVVLLHEVLDVLRGAGFLPAKLVAREGEDAQTLSALKKKG